MMLELFLGILAVDALWRLGWDIWGRFFDRSNVDILGQRFWWNRRNRIIGTNNEPFNRS